MGTEMISTHSNTHSKIDDYIQKFEIQQKHRGLFKSLALLSKKPSIKVPKLKSDEKLTKMTNEQKPERLWKSSNIYIIPSMPDDYDEEKAIVNCDYKCNFCGNLCDVDNLRCKSCANVFHIECLYNRGHLIYTDLPKVNDWACSDCNDLSKLLNEDEMMKLMNFFDELDENKNCLVKCNEYIRLKKKICEEYGQPMSLKEEDAERRHFLLMDTDHSGSVSWNEFINYEAPSLLSKKNKVELANRLTLRELILIKRKFLHFDKTKENMISKDEAKSIYIEYINKLRNKLGRAFDDHLSNCDKLFGLTNGSYQNEKVTWDEFVRKMSVLILFDRLNSEIYAPKYWKPGNWFEANIPREISQFKRQKSLTIFKNLNMNKTSHISSKTLFKINPEKYIDIDYLMKNDIKIENYKAYDDHEFGSHLYVIRSKQFKDIAEELPNLKNSLSPSRESLNTTKVIPPIHEKQKELDKIIIPVSQSSTKNSKITALGFDTPFTFPTITSLSTFAEKSSKANLISKSRLSPIEATPRVNIIDNKNYVYEDLIKNLHNKKRLVHTSHLLKTKKILKPLEINSKEFFKPKKLSLAAYESTLSINTNQQSSIFSYSNNDLKLRNELLEKLSGKKLPELDTINSRSVSKYSHKKKFSQSLDSFYKDCNKNRKNYLKTIWKIDYGKTSDILDNNSDNSDNYTSNVNDLEKSVFFY